MLRQGHRGLWGLEGDWGWVGGGVVGWVGAGDLVAVGVEKGEGGEVGGQRLGELSVRC